MVIQWNGALLWNNLLKKWSLTRKTAKQCRRVMSEMLLRIYGQSCNFYVDPYFKIDFPYNSNSAWLIVNISMWHIYQYIWTKANCVSRPATWYFFDDLMSGSIGKDKRCKFYTTNVKQPRDSAFIRTHIISYVATHTVNIARTAAMCEQLSFDNTSAQHDIHVCFQSIMMTPRHANALLICGFCVEYHVEDCLTNGQLYKALFVLLL